MIVRFLNHSKASLSLAKGPTRFVPVNTVLYQDRMAMDALGKRAGAASRSIRFVVFTSLSLGVRVGPRRRSAAIGC